MRSTVTSMREWMPSVSAVPFAAMSPSSASSSSARQRTTCRTGPNTSAVSSRGAVELDDGRRDIGAGGRQSAAPSARNAPRRRRVHARRSSFRACLGLGVDHRADMGRELARVADLQLARRADDHLDHAVGDVVLQTEQPQRRAALAGGAEGGGDDVVGHLFGQRGGVDDHGVDAAGLGDQRHDRAVLGGERAVDARGRPRSSR